jgi:signal transduction histidine kinase
MGTADAIAGERLYVQPRQARKPRFGFVIALAFAVASAAFVGSTLYADARLARVAFLARQVADNEMPSIDELSTMRRELAFMHLSLDEASEGNPSHLAALAEHREAYQRARQQYELYLGREDLPVPRVPDEASMWKNARSTLDEAERVGDRVLALVRAGALHEADVLVETQLVPLVSRSDELLAGLVRANREQGSIAAVEADDALSRTRRVALLLDALSIILTACVATVAILSARRYSELQSIRANEFEAFASRVAHDIRGPLAPALLWMTRMAREFGDEDPRAIGLQRATRSLGRVEDLVRDLLAFAQSGAAPGPGARTSLRAAVEAVVADAEPEASAAGVRLELTALPACDVACSPGILQSLLANLVRNAIKFMPPDALERRVTLGASVDSGRVHVEVADTGCGVPPEARHRIFLPYVRGDRRQPGLGLGLATVRRLAQAHGGRVGVRSNEQGGATFWFEMPVRSS